MCAPSWKNRSISLDIFRAASSKNHRRKCAFAMSFIETLLLRRITTHVAHRVLEKKHFRRIDHSQLTRQGSDAVGCKRTHRRRRHGGVVLGHERFQFRGKDRPRKEKQERQSETNAPTPITLNIPPLHNCKFRLHLSQTLSILSFSPHRIRSRGRHRRRGH